MGHENFRQDFRKASCPALSLIGCPGLKKPSPFPMVLRFEKPNNNVSGIFYIFNLNILIYFNKKNNNIKFNLFLLIYIIQFCLIKLIVILQHGFICHSTFTTSKNCYRVEKKIFNISFMLILTAGSHLVPSIRLKDRSCICHFQFKARLMSFGAAVCL